MAFAPSSQLAKSLSEFLDCFSRIEVSQTMPAKPVATPPDSTILSNWLASMALPLLATRANAWNFDPWEVAGLGRDEVRNSRILAWLLNPMGSHGFGDVVLVRLLEYLRSFIEIVPSSLGNFCHVRTERSPNGDLSERVDIEIDADTFYLLIEVKIGASEGREQLSRYGKLAQTMAGQRPWAIIYLTPERKEAKTGSLFSDHIFPLSWKKIAQMIEQAIPEAPELPASTCYAARHAAMSFVRHICNH